VTLKTLVSRPARSEKAVKGIGRGKRGGRAPSLDQNVKAL